MSGPEIGTWFYSLSMAAAPDVEGVRIAELVAALSYAADLGLGQPMAHCMRQTVIAQRLAELVGASEAEREAAYYLGLLMNVYCHADAFEQAKWFGDDISFKGDTYDMLELNTAQAIAFIFRRVESHGNVGQRAKRLASFATSGQKEVMAFLTTHSTLGSQFAERLGLSVEACRAIKQGYENWDGKGCPGRVGRQPDQPRLTTRSFREPDRGLRSTTWRGSGSRPCSTKTWWGVRPGGCRRLLRTCLDRGG